jgi:UDP-N-acetylmuramyl pentapeptide phosphotransferase/UDP-N-acetylglucosamine-1-phosphate transferase
MIVEFSIAIFLALGLSLLLNRVMMRVAPYLGLMDQPGVRRIHDKPIPRAGGIAIWLSFLIVLAGVLATGWIPSAGQLSWSWLGAFAAASSVLMVVGFFDDRAGLPPWVKLAAHILTSALFFVLHPVEIGLFPAHWPIVLDGVVFVLWAVLLINAFNLIDGLDGLCGGLAAVALLGMAGLAWTNDRMDAALLLLVMAGAVFGFLKYNFNPARLFLGDAGSMLIGFFLATAATEAVGRRAVVGLIVLPIAVAGVPLLDVLLAIWRRGARRLLQTMRGEKLEGGIFSADSDHLHHRLLARGGTQHRVALVLQGIAIVLATLAFLPMMFGERLYALTLVGFLVVGLIGVKNLACVEIAHTGSVIHMAIKLPGHRRRVAAILFLYDLLVLTGAGAAAVCIETNRLLRGNWEHLLRFVVMFIILECVVLLVGRVHQKLWVRATMRDIILLQFWLLVGAMATFTLFTLMYASLEWSALRLTLMSYVIAGAGICLPRVALDMLREFGMDARFRREKPAAPDEYGPVVVLGAGDMGTLLLNHLKSSSHDAYPGLKILGFLDQQKVMHGRQLRSLRILGDLSLVPTLVKDQGLKGIILAINQPGKELLDMLAAIASQHSLKIYRWKVGMEEEG